MCDQSVGYVCQLCINPFLVLRESGMLLRLPQPNAGLDAAGSKNRLRDLRHEIPRGVWRVEQTGELRALAAKKSTKTDLWKISSLGNSDVRICRDEILLGRANVRTALEKC